MPDKAANERKNPATPIIAALITAVIPASVTLFIYFHSLESKYCQEIRGKAKAYALELDALDVSAMSDRKRLNVLYWNDYLSGIMKYDCEKIKDQIVDIELSFVELEKIIEK